MLVGDLLVNDYSTLPIGSAVGQTFGNLLEVLVATLLMRRLIPRGAPLASVGSLARMVMAIAAGAAVSATVGALSLRLGSVIGTGRRRTSGGRGGSAISPAPWSSSRSRWPGIGHCHAAGRQVARSRGR